MEAGVPGSVKPSPLAESGKWAGWGGIPENAAESPKIPVGGGGSPAPLAHLPPRGGEG